MKAVVVVDNVRRWSLDLRGATVISARDYLSGEGWTDRRGLRVYNLCRSYGYQTLGYYVSLLAAARGHRPLPTVETLQDLRLASVVRLASEQIDDVMQRSLATIKADRFELSVYFGRNMAERHRLLARALYQRFSVPLLKASFERERARWRLVGVRPIAQNEIPESHVDFVIAQAERHFGRPVRNEGRSKSYRYDLAILVDPAAEDAPSDEGALRKFAEAARELDMEPHRIGLEDGPSIAEYDALFIRATTAVDHPTYRIARRAAAEGLVVIDDPISILRCTNKVYLAEVLKSANVPTPRTELLVRATFDDQRLGEVGEMLGYPVVLKVPDGSFSRGVEKASDAKQFRSLAAKLFERSSIILAQEYMYTPFDWRIGLLAGEALFACRYLMSRSHWQIYNHKQDGKVSSGGWETLSVGDVPAAVIDTARQAAALMGDGLYGVDLKQTEKGVFVIEVNDNPNIDAGVEDQILKEALYGRLIDEFIRRIQKVRQG